jgi:hypothetical protein
MLTAIVMLLNTKSIWEATKQFDLSMWQSTLKIDCPEITITSMATSDQKLPCKVKTLFFLANDCYREMSLVNDNY